MTENTNPNLWAFTTPFIHFGIGSLDAIDSVPGDRCFIVTDSGIVRFGLLAILEKKLKEYKKDFKVFSEVEPDPREETALKAAEICKEYIPDLIIALGGGSSIDVAKAIWVLYERPDLKIDDMGPFTHFGLGKKAKLLAIPTTSGTGAEVTWASIITRKMPDGTDFKLELASKELIPNYVILDPIFTKTLPANPTASTALDAVSHIYEGIISIWKNDFSYGMGVAGMDLIRNYLPIALKNGADMKAREKLHNAATMAGLCFGNSQVVMGHSLGHACGAIFHIPHGLCVGTFLPFVLEFALNDPKNKSTEAILGKFAKQLGIAEWSDTDGIAAKKCIEDIRRLIKESMLPKTLSELNISKEKLEKNLDLFVQKAMDSGSSLLSPRAATSEEYKKIILYTFEGKKIDF